MNAAQTTSVSPPRVRVLVVDDSVVVRRMLTKAIDADPGLQVVGTASNGRLALAKLQSTPCDVVTLDLEMPELDGLETLVAVRRDHPRLPVLMCSTLTERGAIATLEALARGASDYVAKPNADGFQDRFSVDLVDKIKALATKARAPRGQSGGPAFPAVPALTPAVRVPARPTPAEAARVVAIGVSTGGPNALAELIPALPFNLAAPVFVVQHMPPVFTKMLAERLSRTSSLPVHEAQAGQAAEAGHVYIAPGDWHMTVTRTHDREIIGLNQTPPENSCRPAVDPLFRSVADVYGSAALGIVLTGMGRDGLHGCEAIHARGGRVLVQDEATSVVWGMPGFVAAAGLAQEVVPLSRIAAAIVQRVRLARPEKGAL